MPGVFIASTEFIGAAETQANALGFAPESVFIQHPIQDRTDEEVQALADNALEAIMAKISRG